MAHSFGGEWTDLKLDVMTRYFAAYAVALKRQSFHQVYWDAFAGTGDRVDPRAQEEGPGPLFGSDAEAVALAKDGSVRLALNMTPGFAHYVLIDRSAGHVTGLEGLKRDFPHQSIEIRHGDANCHLVELCRRTNWTKTRAAVFLDPYGMQLDWATLECLATTKADIALLFPTGSLNRMLRRDGEIPQDWQRRIDHHLGACDWRAAFFRTTAQGSLFGRDERREKAIDINGLRSFVLGRLQSIFAYVHPEALPLENSKGAVLYHLFIICANRSDGARRLAAKLAAGSIGAARRRR